MRTLFLSLIRSFPRLCMPPDLGATHHGPFQLQVTVSQPSSQSHGVFIPFPKWKIIAVGGVSTERAWAGQAGEWTNNLGRNLGILISSIPKTAWSHPGPLNQVLWTWVCSYDENNVQCKFAWIFCLFDSETKTIASSHMFIGCAPVAKQT